MKDAFLRAGFALTDEQIDKFERFADLLDEYNQKFNLTAITDRDEVVIKHFIDSLLGAEFIPQGAKVADVGAGAGFPSVPLKIYRNDIDVTLIDSLNKRVGFLNIVKENLSFNNFSPVHLRAEDAGKSSMRETFDVVVARAVAPLAVLAEYCLPLVRTGGVFLAYKAVADETDSASTAIKLLGGKQKSIHHFTLPDGSERTIIEITKVAPTPSKYPRGQNKPRLTPLA